MTPLRRRMLDALVLHGTAVRTQEAYISAVAQLARYYGRSPDTLSGAQIEAYLLHLLQERHLTRATVNQAGCAINFLFRKVLGQAGSPCGIPLPRGPQKLPEILSREEIARLFACALHLKARTVLSCAYALGLRVSELCALRLEHIDTAADRMCVRVVLHTWTQELRLHIHVHALMACGALAADGGWIAPKHSDRFLFPVRALARVFAGKFRAALESAERDGRLPRDPRPDTGQRRRRTRKLRATPWVVYAKTPLAGAAAVLDYLSRYTHRTAIGQERIVSVRHDGVRLRVRADGGGGKKLVRIDGVDFVGRFLQHVLPAGFKRIRHYGLLAPACKTRRLTQARAALAMPAPNPIARQTAAAFVRRVARIDIERCPHCHGRWRPIAQLAPRHTTRWPRAGRIPTAAQPQAPWFAGHARRAGSIAASLPDVSGAGRTRAGCTPSAPPAASTRAPPCSIAAAAARATPAAPPHCRAIARIAGAQPRLSLTLPSSNPALVPPPSGGSVQPGLSAAMIRSGLRPASPRRRINTIR